MPRIVIEYQDDEGKSMGHVSEAVMRETLEADLTKILADKDTIVALAAIVRREYRKKGS